MMVLVRHRIGTMAPSVASTERSRPRALAERARAGPARAVTELDWRAARRTILHPAAPRGHASVRLLLGLFRVRFGFVLGSFSWPVPLVSKTYWLRSLIKHSLGTLFSGKKPASLPVAAARTTRPNLAPKSRA